MDYEYGRVGLVVMLPHADHNLRGIFQWMDQLKTFEASYTTDQTSGSQVLAVRASLSQTMKGGKVVVLQPKMSLTWGNNYNKPMASVNGEIKRTEKKGSWQYDAKADVQLGANFGASLEGYTLLTDQERSRHVTANASAIYRLSGELKEQKLEMQVQATAGRDSSSSSYDIKWGVRSTAYAQSGVSGSWSLQHSSSAASRLDHQFKLQIGPQRSPDDQLTLMQQLSWVGTTGGGNPSLGSILRITLPSRNVDVALQLNHEQLDDGKTDTSLLARYAPGRQFQTGFWMHRKPHVLLSVDVGFNLSLPTQPVVRVTANLLESRRGSYKTRAEGVWGAAETNFLVSGSLEQLYQSAQRFRRQIDVQLNVTDMPQARLALNYATNATGMMTLLQSSYGKDAVSLHVSRHRPSVGETRFETQLGYLNYVHSALVYSHSLADQRQVLVDVHLDK